MLDYSLAIVLGGILGMYLHEWSHWFIGWLGKTNPDVSYRFWILPYVVRHKEIETMDSEIIRFAGVAPLLWTPAALLAVGLFVLEQSPFALFLAFAPTICVLMSTESDAVAFREPEQYRENAMDGQPSPKPLLLPDVRKWIPLIES